MKTTIHLLVAFLCFATAGSKAKAVSPPPDGGYPGGNTAEGQNALLSRTTGSYNTAAGYLSLLSDTTGSFNTGIGAGTLLSNAGDENTATGAAALLSNTTGTKNTAAGALSLLSNTTGLQNTATGQAALMANTIGNDDTADGAQALASNTTGISNTATGAAALGNNSTGNFNTAHGALALVNNTTGVGNTVIGNAALAQNTVGSHNTAMGEQAGQSLTTGDYNIDIGNTGVAGEANTIRIGDDNHQGTTFIAGVYGVTVAGLAVAMDSSGHLGTVGSSSRFKNEIRPMAQASEAILALNPVTFRYKKEIDPAGMEQFGLVAEEVVNVNPDLVVRDKEGKPYTVRYEAVNAMLLNEFLKEHRKVEQMQKQIEALTVGLQKVSAQLELNKPAWQTAVSNQ